MGMGLIHEKGGPPDGPTPTLLQLHPAPASEVREESADGSIGAHCALRSSVDNLGPPSSIGYAPKSRRVNSLANMPSGSCFFTRSTNLVKLSWCSSRISASVKLSQNFPRCGRARISLINSSAAA